MISEKGAVNSLLHLHAENALLKKVKNKNRGLNSGYSK